MRRAWAWKKRAILGFGVGDPIRIFGPYLFCNSAARTMMSSLIARPSYHEMRRDPRKETARILPDHRTWTPLEMSSDSLLPPRRACARLRSRHEDVTCSNTHSHHSQP